MKRRLLCAALVLLFASGASVVDTGAHQRRRAPRRFVPRICNDPTVPCRTTNQFEPHELPFTVPADGVIEETEQFYAVILKSIRDPGCSRSIPEPERLQAQRLFPHNKVFASRCGDAGSVYYREVAPETQLMAVFAGRTRAEAMRFLATVRATGRYPGANLRRLRAGFNGT